VVDDTSDILGDGIGGVDIDVVITSVELVHKISPPLFTALSVDVVFTGIFAATVNKIALSVMIISFVGLYAYNTL